MSKTSRNRPLKIATKHSAPLRELHPDATTVFKVTYPVEFESASVLVRCSSTWKLCIRT